MDDLVLVSLYTGLRLGGAVHVPSWRALARRYDELGEPVLAAWAAGLAAFYGGVEPSARKGVLEFWVTTRGGATCRNSEFGYGIRPTDLRLGRGGELFVWSRDEEEGYAICPLDLMDAIEGGAAELRLESRRGGSLEVDARDFAALMGFALPS